MPLPRLRVAPLAVIVLALSVASAAVTTCRRTCRLTRGHSAGFGSSPRRARLAAFPTASRVVAYPSRAWNDINGSRGPIWMRDGFETAINHGLGLRRDPAENTPIEPSNRPKRLDSDA